MEIWKSIAGYENYYEASDFGRVRGVARQVKTKGGGLKLLPVKILTAHEDGGGYLHVVLYRNGKGKTTKVHKIILETFVGPCPPKMECCHRDGVRANNCLKNVRWGTRLENAADKIGHGTAPIGENNSRAKLVPVQVMEIYHRAKGGEQIADIAADYGVSNITVSHIKCGRTWTHLTCQDYVCGRTSVTGALTERIEALKRDGKTLDQIVTELGVSRSTAFRHGGRSTGATARGF